LETWWPSVSREGSPLSDGVSAFSKHGSHVELWAVPAVRTRRVHNRADVAQAAASTMAFGTAPTVFFAGLACDAAGAFSSRPQRAVSA
jgi:hypothetical protein